MVKKLTIRFFFVVRVSSKLAPLQRVSHRHDPVERHVKFHISKLVHLGLQRGPKRTKVSSEHDREP